MTKRMTKVQDGRQRWKLVGNISTAGILNGNDEGEGNLEVARLMKEATYVYHQI
jgi:hypothetical protein